MVGLLGIAESMNGFILDGRLRMVVVGQPSLIVLGWENLHFRRFSDTNTAFDHSWVSEARQILQNVIRWRHFNGLRAVRYKNTKTNGKQNK